MRRALRLKTIGSIDKAEIISGQRRVDLPEPGEIHVWVAALDDAGWTDDLAFIDMEEKARAERFYFPVHARRFRRGRIMRRIILGNYLGMDPDKIRFETAIHGRPSLEANETGGHAIDFNMSNSEEVVVLAVATDRRIGVDVELEKPMPDADSIARGSFHAKEAASVAATEPPGDKLEAFFRCWTRKEAVVKAVGSGLQMDLNGFFVGTGRRVDPFQPLYEPHFEGARSWWVADFSQGPVYAALAMDGPPKSLTIRRWKP